MEENGLVEKILLMPDVQAHAAYLEANQRRQEDHGEIRLVRQIFKDGIETFWELTVSHAHPHLLRASRDWIFRKDNDWIFSFESICTILDIDASYWRKICRAYEKKHAPAAYK